jgi:hypothetical protein
MTAARDPIHPAAKICPIEHDPERNRLQKAVLDAAISYYLIDARCTAFFIELESLSGKYADPRAKGRELEELEGTSRLALMATVRELVASARPARATRPKRARRA